MQSSSEKLLLMFVLCVALWSQAESKVTLIDFDVEVPGNDIVKAWTYERSDNQVDSQIDIGTNCPESLGVDINVYQDDRVVNQINKKFEKPMEDIRKTGICETIDVSEPEDDSCSIAEGKQDAKNCDVSELFSDMSPGYYKTVAEFKQNDNLISIVTINVKVE